MGLLERRMCRLCPRAAKLPAAHQLDATERERGEEEGSICLIGGTEIVWGHGGQRCVFVAAEVCLSVQALLYVHMHFQLLMTRITMLDSRTTERVSTYFDAQFEVSHWIRLMEMAKLKKTSSIWPKSSLEVVFAFFSKNRHTFPEEILTPWTFNSHHRSAEEEEEVSAVCVLHDILIKCKNIAGSRPLLLLLLCLLQPCVTQPIKPTTATETTLRVAKFILSVDGNVSNLHFVYLWHCKTSKKLQVHIHNSSTAANVYWHAYWMLSCLNSVHMLMYTVDVSRVESTVSFTVLKVLLSWS